MDLTFLTTCLEQWHQCADGSVGLLCGLVELTAKKAEVFSTFNLDLTLDFTQQIHDCFSVIPQGFGILGVCHINPLEGGETSGEDDTDDALSQLYTFLQESDGVESGPYYVSVTCVDQACGRLAESWMIRVGEADADVRDMPLAQVMATQSRLLCDDHFYCYRLKANIPLQFSGGTTNEETGENLCSSLKSVDIIPTFLITDSDVLLEAESKKAELRTCVLLHEHLKTHCPASLHRHHRDKLACDMVHVKMVQRMTNKPSGCVPMIDYKRDGGCMYSLSVRLDSVVYVYHQRHMSDLPHIFATALTKQLSLIADQVYATDELLVVPRPHIFIPSPLQHPLTLLYSTSNQDHVTKRSKRYQRLFMIGESKMSLQPVFAIDEDRREMSGTSNHLRNVHVGVAVSGVCGGVVHVVQGDYLYYHYMQDRMDDTGWGCAYRSLQTICSWYRGQCYLTLPVPTHTQIQQALVDIGDKPSAFVGSRQWIGSMEVGYVLNHLYEIESRYISVNSGSELSDKAREIAQHFDTQGSPIMIGGGVKAHTILGIHFNPQTGDSMFLILDPHYTGADELAAIINKGWCGWKTTDFFDQAAFYNLCLPQIPQSSKVL